MIHISFSNLANNSPSSKSIPSKTTLKTYHFTTHQSVKLVTTILAVKVVKVAKRLSFLSQGDPT